MVLCDDANVSCLDSRDLNDFSVGVPLVSKLDERFLKKCVIQLQSPGTSFFPRPTH